MASITVTATGRAPVEEHRAEVVVRLEAQADLPGEALTKLAAKVERLRGLLAERSVADDAVTTEHLDVQPRWDQATGTTNGAVAGTNVRVEVGATAEVGPLLDHLLAGIGEGAGVQQVAQVPVRTPEQEAAARRAAVAQAQQKAEQLAEALGGRVGGVLSLLEGTAPGGWAPFAPMAAAARKAEAHLWERSSEVTVTVTAVYEIVESDRPTAQN